MLPYRKSHGTISNFRSRIASQALIAGLFPYARLRKLHMRSPRLHPSAAPVQSEADIEPDSSPPSYRGLRIAYWCVALALGAADAWANRFTMNPDGVSYLDIGDAYWHGDWHNAINAYWSPLYSWILGFFLKVVKPSAYWEYPLVHLVNFLIYVAALACFEFFLKAFIADRRRRDQELLKEGQMGLPESSWWLLSYSLFVSSSIILIGLRFATPDMCVAALVYLASGLILRMRAGAATRKSYLVFGACLGFAYLTKAVMFPLGFAFLFAALLKSRTKALSVRKRGTAALIFLAISFPFVLAISLRMGRPTFGDSGKINYEIEVQRDDWFVPHQATPMHPVTRVRQFPLSYKFEQNISGAYPLWHDPSYWHEGVKTHFSLAQQTAAFCRSLSRYKTIISSRFFQLNVALALLLLFLLAPSFEFFGRSAELWPLAVPATTALLLYSLVVVEFRYVAPFMLIVWLTLFAGLRLPSAMKDHKLISAVFVGLLFTVVILAVLWINNASQVEAIQFSRIAERMHGLGLQPGDKLAVVGPHPEGEDGAYAARLARVEIVGEVLDRDGFFAASPTVRAEIFSSLASNGARGVMACGKQPNDLGWERLGTTGCYLLEFSRLTQTGVR